MAGSRCAWPAKLKQPYWGQLLVAVNVPKNVTGTELQRPS